MTDHDETQNLVSHVKSVLLHLNAQPYPDVASPPGVPKRASVALIIRIQPDNAHWPSSQDKTFFESSQPSLDSIHTSQGTNANTQPDSRTALSNFFEQDWVKHGDPEMLFIKRAIRIGDKWNGHTALPGGKRDPEDKDDAYTAKRETLEEVGIDLGPNQAISVGNLPPRIVTTSWGKVPLMVLCPYIFLLTSPSYPSQRLQPTEVASSHWVPLRALLIPTLRTYEYADVSARFAKTDLNIKRWFLQAMLSKMMFAAICLVPTNSMYCGSIPDFLLGSDVPSTGYIAGTIEVLTGSGAGQKDRRPPLLLWGLTLGVVSDFLEHLPPHNALELWTYPTFAHWDVRLVVWAMSYRFRARKATEMSTVTSSTSISHSLSQVPIQDLPSAGSEALETLGEEEVGEVGIAGLGVGSGWGQTGRAKMIARGAAVNSLLEGYYPIVRRAVAIALAGRVGLTALLVYLVWKRLKGMNKNMFDKA